MYPIALSLRDRRVLVAGGGAVAERKVRGLLEAAALVTVVSPDVTEALAQLAAAGAIAWERRAFAAPDLDAAVLAFAATGDPEVNASIAAAARERGILIDDVSDANRSDFATPAVHRAGPLTVTVDSGGLSPSFARRVRDEIAVQVDVRYGRAAAVLGAVRERVLAVVPPGRRAAVLREFAERDLDELAAMPPASIEHEVERVAASLAPPAPSTARPLVCASRASALAMIQTRSVMAALAQAGLPAVVLNVTTRGDAVQDRSIAAIGTDNVWVKELELALRDERADLAVHSCKDLPSELAPDMRLAAITARHDPRDAFCSERYPSFDALPRGARVGTSSPRRRALLAALRPDLALDDVRGNVDTRLRKLREGGYDALVLACAGLERLGARAAFTVPFATDVLVPAVGQGALGIETRAGDPLGDRLAAILGDPAAVSAVTTERAFLRTMRGGCRAPIGAHAAWEGEVLRLVAAVASADGSRVLQDAREARLQRGERDAADALGVALAREMLASGAASLLGGGPLSGRLVLLPRTVDRPSRIAPALRETGAEVVEAPDSRAAYSALGGRIPSAILFPSSGSVAAIEEYLAALRDGGHRPVVAAMGPSSSKTAGERGWPPDVVAPSAEVGAFVQSVMLYLLENEG